MRPSSRSTQSRRNIVASLAIVRFMCSLIALTLAAYFLDGVSWKVRPRKCELGGEDMTFRGKSCFSFIHVAHAEGVPFATIGFTKATLLSGGLSDCIPSPNVSSCAGGLASARAVFRSITNARGSLNTEFVYSLDTSSAFVQMHPLEYTVNIVTMREFGIRYYFAEPTILNDRERRKAFDLFFNDDVQLAQANLDIPSYSDWDGYVHRQILLFNNTVGVIVVGTSAHPDAVSSALVLPTAIKYLRSRVKVIVVVQNDISTSSSDLLSAMAGDLPEVFIDLQVDVAVACYTYNSTLSSTLLYCGSPAGASDPPITLLHLFVSGGVLSGANISTEPITSLSGPVLDAQYYADQAFLKAQAQQAISYDPVVGNTTVAMPLGGWVGGQFPCLGAECPQATLFGKALLHYVATSNLVIINGLAIRGQGWPAGNIHMSHLWEMLPYANSVASLTVLGLKLWALFNISAFNYANGTSFDSFSDYFLQGAGFQIDIDISKPRFTNRLLAVRVYNKTSGSWEALVRTKYYGLAIDSYMLQRMTGYSAIAQSLYRGESLTYPYGTALVQEAIGDYLSAVSPFDSLLDGRYVFDDSGDRPAMDWVQTSAMCSGLQYWDAGIVTCVECPSGSVRSPTSVDACVPAPQSSSSSDSGNSTVLLAVIIPLVGILALIAAAIVAWLEYRRRQSTRNTDSAPKSGDQITIVFTDIQSSTKLWGTVPASMAAALETHHRLIRECISSFGAYEVKTIGDSFMIACDSAERAVGMAVAIEERLAVQSWPACIGEVYACEGSLNESEHLDTINDNPKRLIASTIALVSGLKVRIGISCGLAEVHFDEVSKGYDYFGPAVNMAARIESAAQGGQILISRQTATLLPPSDKFEVCYFADVALADLPGKTELLEILSPMLVASLPIFSHNNIPKKALVSGPAPLHEQEGSVSRLRSGLLQQAVNRLGPVTTASGEALTRSADHRQPCQGESSHSMANDDRRKYILLCMHSLDATFRLLQPSMRAEVVKALTAAWRVTPLSANAAETGLLAELGDNRFAHRGSGDAVVVVAETIKKDTNRRSSYGFLPENKDDTSAPSEFEFDNLLAQQQNNSLDHSKSTQTTGSINTLNGGVSHWPAANSVEMSTIHPSATRAAGAVGVHSVAARPVTNTTMMAITERSTTPVADQSASRNPLLNPPRQAANQAQSKVLSKEEVYEETLARIAARVAPSLKRKVEKDRLRVTDATKCRHYSKTHSNSSSVSTPMTGKSSLASAASEGNLKKLDATANSHKKTSIVVTSPTEAVDQHQLEYPTTLESYAAVATAPAGARAIAISIVDDVGIASKSDSSAYRANYRLGTVLPPPIQGPPRRTSKQSEGPTPSNPPLNAPAFQNGGAISLAVMEVGSSNEKSDVPSVHFLGNHSGTAVGNSSATPSSRKTEGGSAGVETHTALPNIGKSYHPLRAEGEEKENAKHPEHKELHPLPPSASDSNASSVGSLLATTGGPGSILLSVSEQVGPPIEVPGAGAGISHKLPTLNALRGPFDSSKPNRIPSSLAKTYHHSSGNSTAVNSFVADNTNINGSMSATDGNSHHSSQQSKRSHGVLNTGLDASDGVFEFVAGSGNHPVIRRYTNSATSPGSANGSPNYQHHLVHLRQGAIRSPLPSPEAAFRAFPPPLAADPSAANTPKQPEKSPTTLSGRIRRKSTTSMTSNSASATGGGGADRPVILMSTEAIGTRSSSGTAMPPHPDQSLSPALSPTAASEFVTWTPSIQKERSGGPKSEGRSSVEADQKSKLETVATVGSSSDRIEAGTPQQQLPRSFYRPLSDSMESGSAMMAAANQLVPVPPPGVDPQLPRPSPLIPVAGTSNHPMAIKAGHLQQRLPPPPRRQLINLPNISHQVSAGFSSRSSNSGASMPDSAAEVVAGVDEFF